MSSFDDNNNEAIAVVESYIPRELWYLYDVDVTFTQEVEEPKIHNGKRYFYLPPVPKYWTVSWKKTLPGGSVVGNFVESTSLEGAAEKVGEDISKLEAIREKEYTVVVPTHYKPMSERDLNRCPWLKEALKNFH